MDSIKPNINWRRLPYGVLLVLALSATNALAQAKKVELSGYVGRQWGALVDETTKDEGVDSLASALGINAGAGFGFIFTYHVSPRFHLELSWDTQPTKLEFIDRATDSTATVADLSVHYYQIGFIYSWSQSTRQPFVGMTVGLANWEPDGGYESESGLCFGPVFGYKVWMSENFGFRAHGRIMMSNIPSGELFANPAENFSFTHTKDTWATQIQIGIAVVVGK